MAAVFVFALLPSANAMGSTIAIHDEDYLHSSDVLKTICPDFPLDEGEITTREEFVASVVMALGMPEGVSVPLYFRDVSADNKYSSRIAYAVQLGLISNVDLFYPLSPVTYEQAIKIVMTAAGYGKKAEFTGGYPFGYINSANEAGVGMTLKSSIGSTLTHKEATELIFEACIADMMEETTFGDKSDYSITEGKNILSSHHSVYMAEGVVSANEHTGLKSISSYAKEGFVTIDGNDYRIGESEDFLGRRVRIFYKDNYVKDIICIYECDNEVINYTSADEPLLSGSVLTVYPKDSRKEIKYNLNDYAFLYNGKCFNTQTPQTYINNFSGRLALIDNDTDGNIDVIEIMDISYGIIGSVNEFDEKVYDKYKREGILDLSDMKYNVKEDDGTPIDLGDLEEDDAVGYLISNDNKKCEIIRYNSARGGVLDSVTSGGKIVVSAEEYTLSKYYTDNIKDISKIKLGSEVVLNIGEAGDVIYVKEFASGIKYGFFVAAGTVDGLDNGTKVMIFGDDGILHELDIAQKIKINDTLYTQTLALPVLETLEGEAILKRVIKYSLNIDGKVNNIYTAKENTEGSKVFLSRTEDEARPVLFDDNTNHGYTGSEGKLAFKNDVFYPYFTMAPDCVIFKVPNTDNLKYDEKYYSVASNTEVKEYATAHNDSIECFGYDVDMDGASFILWISNEGGSSGVAEESANAIVEDITRGINLEGEECYVVKLFADGKAEKYYSTPEREAVVSQMKPGDIVQVSYNRDREITGADINFIWSTKTITGNAGVPQGYNGHKMGFAAGYFYNFSGKTGMIVRNKTIDEIALDTDLFGTETIGSTNYSIMYPANLGRGKVYFVKFNYDRITGNIKDAVVHAESDTSSIESYYSAGKNADYMVQRARYQDISYTVVYVN